MRYVDTGKITVAIEQMCIKACHELTGDVFDALKKASQEESNPRGRKILNQLIENAQLAKQQNIPL